MRKLDEEAAKMAKQGDAVELHGPVNEHGGRPVIAAIEHDGAGFVRKGDRDKPEKKRSKLADALSDIDPEHADRDDWEFVSD